MSLLFIVSEAIADPLVESYVQQGLERANELSISRAAHVQVSSSCKEKFMLKCVVVF